MRCWPVTLTAAVIASWTVVHAENANFPFSSTQNETRFAKLIQELRCLVCQNQSLADSDAELAGDLRREVFSMIEQGVTDQEIIGFLVARYGEFVLYRPRVKPETYLLWFGPFVLLLVGALVLVYLAHRRPDVPAGAYQSGELERVRRLLEQDNKE